MHHGKVRNVWLAPALLVAPLVLAALPQAPLPAQGSSQAGATPTAAERTENAGPQGYVDLDFTKVDRSIQKEPAYLATPRYAMFVFDLAGQHRVWAVADKSEKDGQYYDVLYLDLDGDGDLTEAGERFGGSYDQKRAAAGIGLLIKVGDIAVPGTDLKHTDFILSTTPKAGRGGFWFRMKWNGEQEMSGGYGPVGIDTTVWREQAATAPIFRPCPFGPLTFGAWGTTELALAAGGSFHLNVIAGNAGSSTDTLAVVDENFLDLKLDELRVTVIARDAAGKEVRATSRIDDHC